MSEYVVAVVDGAKARFFTLEEAEFPEYESGPNLIERDRQLNEASELPGKDLWANVKTGRNRGSSGQAHAYDDHRDNHVGEFGRRFAQSVAQEIVDLTRAYTARRVVLVAEPQTLGVVREALAPLLGNHLQLQELCKDLCKLKPLDLHEHLASHDLLPPRRRMAH